MGERTGKSSLERMLPDVPYGSASSGVPASFYKCRISGSISDLPTKLETVSYFHKNPLGFMLKFETHWYRERVRTSKNIIFLSPPTPLSKEREGVMSGSTDKEPGEQHSAYCL